MFLVEFPSKIFRVLVIAINNKNEKQNDWGQSLDLPVAGFGPVSHAVLSSNLSELSIGQKEHLDTSISTTSNKYEL